jgi:hypothetical protein
MRIFAQTGSGSGYNKPGTRWTLSIKRSDPRSDSNGASLAASHIATPTGAQVPLQEVASLRIVDGVEVVMTRASLSVPPLTTAREGSTLKPYTRGRDYGAELEMRSKRKP